MKSLLLVLSASFATCFPSGSRPSERPLALDQVLGLTNLTQVDFDLGGASASAGGVDTLSRRAVQGPHMGRDFPDPSLIFGEGSWKAYGTSSSGKGIPVATSADGQTWTFSDQDALPTPGAWVDAGDRGLWAPDVNKNDDGTYVMYYTGKKSGGGSHCIGVATAAVAAGPFVALDEPLICDDAGGGVIDPAGYDDGVDRWILWKVDGNSLGGASSCTGGPRSGGYTPTPIKIQRMARDAMTLLDSPKTILDNEGASNDGVVEAPTLYKVRDDLFVLFYSAHCYSSDDYDLEYAWSSTIDGAYGDRGVLLRTVDNRGIFGPGHMDIDPNGSNVVFHGRTAANEGGGGTRYMYSAQLTIDGKAITAGP
ncbi:hypothetical protein SLS62_008508 [Diatrype stigma]|uniref:Glycoside hydrolase family 43 protein n=1 Tax=Diatrype stigma TaxID=117547 RepID=A0AAN9URE3_9PEZI